MSGLIIVCVRTGTSYAFEYVTKLRNMVAGHLARDYVMVCLTDQPERCTGVTFIDVTEAGLHGWWGKMLIFEPTWRRSRVCYIDLDTVIVGNLAPLADVPGEFAICESFVRLAGITTYACAYNSSVMVIGGGMAAFMWEKFEADRDRLMEKHARYGDQACIEELYPDAPFLQRLLPQGFFCNYRHLTNHVPNAVMVNFGGAQAAQLPDQMGAGEVAVIFDLDGKQLRIIDVDDRIVLHMGEPDGYERETLAAWAQIVKPGMVAVDVGAYTGLFSIIAASKGARVVAVEPMPANRWRMGVNAALNKVTVEVFECALSDRNGMDELHYNRNVPLTTGASLEDGNEMHNERIAVQLLTLDSLALSNVAAIKIDVERHEPAVLRGAMRTIERDRPSMLIETLDAAMRETVRDMLPSYRIAAILDGRNTLFTPT